MFRLTVEIKHVNGEHFLLQIPSALLRRPPQQSQAGDRGVWWLHSKPDKWSARLSPSCYQATLDPKGDIDHFNLQKRLQMKIFFKLKEFD